MANPFRILVVDDDEDLSALIHYLLTKRGGYEVSTADSAEAATVLLDAEEWDLLLTDLHMPGRDGLAVAEAARSRRPDLPILLMTAQPSLDSAVLAVRQNLTDFLLKPLDPEELLGTVSRALAVRRRQRRRVLAIGAHPDDVEIGAGATLAAHDRRGDEVQILTMSRGRIGGDEEQRTRESGAAARVLGAKLRLGDLMDTEIAEHGATVSLIESTVDEFHPQTVYVHSINDVHQDHRNVHRAAMVACRGVPQVFCYQSPSATIDFRPSKFVSVEESLDRKLESIAVYASQTAIRDYLDEDVLRSTARYWGRFGRCRYAEPFEVIRDAREHTDG